MLFLLSLVSPLFVATLFEVILCFGVFVHFGCCLFAGVIIACLWSFHRGKTSVKVCLFVLCPTCLFLLQVAC